MSRAFDLVDLENCFPAGCVSLSEAILDSVQFRACQNRTLSSHSHSEQDKLHTRAGFWVEITHCFMLEGVSVGIAAFPDGFLHMLKFDWVDIRPTVTRARVCVCVRERERVCVSE